MTANRLSYHLDLKGPSVAVDTACSSSLVAVHMACAALARRGVRPVARRRGQPHPDPGAEHLLHAGRAVGRRTASCKPFSGDADGIGRGEGVAVLVLRRLADAQAAALPIYAVIEGGAVNSDGRSNGLTAPNRWAQQQVVATAYEQAGVRPEQISFIEAHGTGTVLGDMIEVKALGELHRVPRRDAVRDRLDQGKPRPHRGSRRGRRADQGGAQPAPPGRAAEPVRRSGEPAAAACRSAGCGCWPSRSSCPPRRCTPE